MPTESFDISGVYANEATIVDPRRDIPNERVSFSGLRFPNIVTSKVGPITSVRLTQRREEVQFDFLDAAGMILLTDLVTKPKHTLELGPSHVTFRDFEKTKSPEIGNVRTKSRFKMTLDEDRRLIVELALNYTRTTLFGIPVSGTDRAVYAFTRNDNASLSR